MSHDWIWVMGDCEGKVGEDVLSTIRQLESEGWYIVSVVSGSVSTRYVRIFAKRMKPKEL
jgi:hypothetical protein